MTEEDQLIFNDKSFEFEDLIQKDNKQEFFIRIICESEKDQKKTYEDLIKKGLSCFSYNKNI